jgi:hypothetical protein
MKLTLKLCLLSLCLFAFGCADSGGPATPPDNPAPPPADAPGEAEAPPAVEPPPETPPGS